MVQITIRFIFLRDTRLHSFIVGMYSTVAVTFVAVLLSGLVKWENGRMGEWESQEDGWLAGGVFVERNNNNNNNNNNNKTYTHVSRC